MSNANAFATSSLTVFLVFYLSLTILYLAAQTRFAQRAHQGHEAEPAYEGPAASGAPDVDVIIPCYNEDPEVLAGVLASIAAQDYPGKLSVYLVDDGSRNRIDLQRVYDSYVNDARFTFILLDRNGGKRKAQVAGILRSSGELICGIDSDTKVRPDTIRKLTAAMADPSVGSAMGQMVASNRDRTWLTWLINKRYWLACNQERAAQSAFGAVLCCCGPCSIYRRSVVLDVLDEYVHQTFRGRPSEFGEDRHLTTLILRSDLRTVYVPDAMAATEVPERLRPYVRQQLRWSRSTYRDTFLLIKILRRLHPYLTLDIIAQNLMPLFLGLTVLAGLATVVTSGSLPPWPTFAIAALTALLQCCYGVYRTRSLGFLVFVLYGIIHVVLLLPTRAYAVCSIGNPNWGSRVLEPQRKRRSRRRPEPRLGDDGPLVTYEEEGPALTRRE